MINQYVYSFKIRNLKDYTYRKGELCVIILKVIIITFSLWNN